MKFIKHKNTWCWGKSTIIITNDGCGTVTVQFDNDFPDDANICGLSVYEAKRNKGYGTKLLHEAEKEVKENNRKNIFISCESNSWIEEWYIKNGYKKCGYTEGFENKVSLLKKYIVN